MRELANANGDTCAVLRAFSEDGQTWAIPVAWRCSAEGLPSEDEFHEALGALIVECQSEGALSIGTRVTTHSDGVSDEMTSERAAFHRGALIAYGFERGEDRVEYRMELREALKVTDGWANLPTLKWKPIDSASEADVAWAGTLYRQACVGDPSEDPNEDPLGFVRMHLADEDIVQTPSPVQIGMCDDQAAVFLALSVDPNDGWSSVHYLGVLPPFRGRGIGLAAMKKGLQLLQSMGGELYHDGTAAENIAARALFERLGRSPFRTMEEWRLVT